LPVPLLLQLLSQAVFPLRPFLLELARGLHLELLLLGFELLLDASDLCKSKKCQKLQSRRRSCLFDTVLAQFVPQGVLRLPGLGLQFATLLLKCL
jgi:hypothetical protein